VDRQRGHGHGDARGDRRLPCRDLARARRKDLTHDQVLDVLRGHARLVEGAPDGDTAEVGGREVLEGPQAPTHRRPGAGDDDGGVAVTDYQSAVDLYQRVFGMRLVHEEVNEEQGVREAMLAVGDSGSCVQVLAPLTPDSTIARFLDRSGPGLQQVAYRVEDV